MKSLGKLLAMLGLGLSVATQAAAQEPRRQLEEVVVTAQYREQNLQDVPLSVTAISAKDLAEAQVFGATEIAHRVPGMAYAEFSPGQANISMRGITTNDDGAGIDNSVVMFLDGVYIGRLANINFEMFDLDRIEVLRGPQGTLFGRNAIGGAINVTSTRPTDEFTARAEIAAGNYGHLRYQALVSGPLSDNLKGKLTYNHRSHDGYVDNIVLDKEQQDENSDSVRGQLLFTTDNTEWLLTGDYMEDDREDMGRVPIVPGGDPNSVMAWRDGGGKFRKVTAPSDGDSYRDAGGISLQGDIQFDTGALTTITAWREVGTDWNMASIGVGWRGGVEVVDSIKEDIRTWSQELRWTSNLDGNVNFVAGLFLLREETDRTEQFFVESPAGPNSSYIKVGNEIAIQSNTTDSYAAYASGDWAFAEDWTLTLGARFTRDKKETESTSVNCGGTLTGEFENYPACAGLGGSLRIIPETFNAKGDEEWDDFSPRASLQWQPTNDLMWFFTASRGFKSGGFGGAPGSLEQATEPVDAETAWNYELGMKGDFLDRTLRVNATIFYTDYEDLQVVRFGPTPANPDFGQFVTENLGTARIQGLEGEATWYPVDNLRLSGSYAYLETEVSDLIIRGGAGPVDVSGSDLRQAPKHSVSLTGSYDVPLQGGALLNFRADYTYTDEQINDYLNQRTVIEERGLIDARASWVSADKSWQVALWGRNLTDDEYIAHSYTIGPGVIGVWGPPRTYGLTLSYML